VDKGQSSDGEEQWIVAYDPNQPEGEAIKIMVSNEMLWENIKTGEDYAATYRKVGDGEWVLEELQ